MSDSLSMNKSTAVPWICGVLLFLTSFPKWIWNTSPTFGLTVVPWVLLLFALGDMMKNKVGWKGIVALFFQILIF